MTASSFRWLASVFAGLATASAAAAQQGAPSATPTPTPVAATANPVTAAAKPPAPNEPKTVWSQVHVSGPYIAMTFDDGPSAKLTPQLLDMLKERQMRVTFFVVGENAKAHPEILRREIAEGHEVANHSWSHPNLAKMSDEAVKSELNRTKEAIVAAINKPVPYLRPPYGSFTKDQRRWFHDDLGYTMILWDVDPDDWKRPGPETIQRRIVDGTRNGSIILAHDIHAGTIQAMPATFDALLAKGFKFVTVSELIAMDEPQAPKPEKTGGAKPGQTPRPGAKASAVPANLPEKITGD